MFLLRWSSRIAARSANTPMCILRTEEQKTAYATAFKNQSKYGTLRGYMFAQEYAKLGD